MGKVKMVIYGNQTFRGVGARTIGDRIASVNRVFALQGEKMQERV